MLFSILCISALLPPVVFILGTVLGVPPVVLIHGAVHVVDPTLMPSLPLC